MAKNNSKTNKRELLSRHSCLNPKHEQVTDACFKEDTFFDPRDLVQVKYEMLRKVAVDNQGVSETARRFGFSRPSFYKARDAFECEGLVGLMPKKRGPQTRHKISDEILNFVRDVLADDESTSMADLADKVKSRFGVVVHPRSIDRAINGKKKTGQTRER